MSDASYETVPSGDYDRPIMPTPPVAIDKSDESETIVSIETGQDDVP